MHFEEAGRVEETTPTRPARLLIADDHALVRYGLRTVLSGEDSLMVVPRLTTAKRPSPPAEL